MNQLVARGTVSRTFLRSQIPRRALRVSTVMTKKDPQEVISDFRSHVNMSVKELQEWLETDKSQEIGWNPEGGESKGHQSGRYICELLPKKDADFSDEDIQHMTHVNAYCKRHLAQRPKDVEDSKWRYSLMNWCARVVFLLLLARCCQDLSWIPWPWLAGVTTLPNDSCSPWKSVFVVFSDRCWAA